VDGAVARESAAPVTSAEFSQGFERRADTSECEDTGGYSPPTVREKVMATKQSSSSRSNPSDAVSLLKADHRQVEEWFSDFEKTNSTTKKTRLASNICEALTIHTTIEEEIFYPAFLQATKDKDIHHEAVVEHEGAKKLIAQIQGMSPEDDYFDAKVTVLSEMIKHHVKEEEKPGGMFAEAKKSDLDLAALGKQLLARKKELQSQAKAA
jgi:hemerythrin superfamily protein